MSLNTGSFLGRTAAMLCALWLWVGVSQAQHTPEAVRDQVFVTAQRATTSVAGAALQQAALRQQAGNAELAALLRQRSDLSDAAAAEQKALGIAIQAQGAAAETETARIRNALAEIRARTQAMDARIEAAFPAFRELVNPRPMTVTEVQQTLQPGEVMIVTLTSEYEAYIWAISADRADWNAVTFDQGDLVARITLLRRMLDVTTQNRAAAALEEEEDSEPANIGSSARDFDRALAHGLYTDLLAPLAPVFEEATRLIVVPDGPLTSLPFGLLVASPPQGDDSDPLALRDTDWLIKRHAMVVLPNVSSLRALRRSALRVPDAAGPRRPFVGFGDPIFDLDANGGGPTGVVSEDGYVSRGGFEQLRAVAGLAPLPGTARELRKLAELTGVSSDALVLGRRATESAVRGADLSNVDILAFATHGLLAGELAELTEPALVFTPPGTPGPEDDALLTASEAAALKLSAQLIILSACNTASGDGTPGAEGLSGLARSFIYAGARSILVSHWPVDDFATSELTTGMVAQMQAGAPRDVALRQAMLDLMHRDLRGRYAHPRFWAPFILVGEG